MTGIIVESLLLLLAHAAAGIYSSTLKYSKTTTYIIWGGWIALQTGLLIYAESKFTNWAVQFLLGFVVSLVGQYILFFATTKGNLAQRIFTMLTYSIFFCIIMAPFIMAKDALSQLHWSLTVLVQAALLFGIVAYFLGYICPLCRAASKSITAGWRQMIFVNIVFLITVILSSVYPAKLTGFSDPSFIAFVFLSVSIMAVYPVIFVGITHMSEAATKREVEVQNQLLIAQIELEKAQIAVEAQARHDRRHHNLVMLEYANQNDIESVRQHLKSLVEWESQAVSGEKYCDNLTVHTVLSVYERQAKEKGICVNISAKASRELTVLPQDLVIVIANLFENAIHATEKLKTTEKVIDIDVKDSDKRLLIKMENPCKHHLHFDESLYGIGIRSVINTTNKYEGMHDFSAEDGIFSAKISLNLV
ncbi:MAG: GHKL domain-containing protein [Clostridia bacterium]|nr:GHKL domain-containing protein [Clostridia bacterium]